MSGLPQVIAEIAEVAGPDAAWALAAARGGQQVFIPATVKPGHWLADLVGLEAAEKICGHFSANGRGDTILIPMATLARKREAIARALSGGAKIDQAAGMAGVHRRTVFRHKRRRTEAADRPTDQGDFFD
ncbi:helix-turn-helix domain-containing protein [Devosia sp.]|uniref:helix-turn-helix domain-containing protein n=1 Tax=Devosia sp. TaxID=1871048 RepID=UPI001AD424A1|nr:helix-turn-helix domain-containing protein [Devosia sp.]MBN9334697.1 helix-turn-helix domain-containing protein [Devosia sp.]